MSSKDLGEVALTILHNKGYIKIKKSNNICKCYYNAKCILEIIDRVKNISISRKRYGEFSDDIEELAMYISILSINHNNIGSATQFTDMEFLSITGYIVTVILKYMNLKNPIEHPKKNILTFQEKKSSRKPLEKLMRKQEKISLFPDYGGLLQYEKNCTREVGGKNLDNLFLKLE